MLPLRLTSAPRGSSWRPCTGRTPPQGRPRSECLQTAAERAQPQRGRGPRSPVLPGGGGQLPEEGCGGSLTVRQSRPSSRTTGPAAGRGASREGVLPDGRG